MKHREPGHEPDPVTSAPISMLPPPVPPATVEVAYHAGPPELMFYGRLWYRGASQPVPQADWEAMQARGDFPIHDFRIA